MVKTKVIYDGDDLILFVARMKEAIQKGYNRFKVDVKGDRVAVYAWRAKKVKG